MIYLVRHGQTKQNRAGVLQGRSDFPLNEQGEEQARRVGAYFRAQGVRFDVVYSSPLCRARQTAALISGADADIRVDERLTRGWICASLHRRCWPSSWTL